MKNLPPMPETQRQTQQLIDYFQPLSHVVIAFSGGVDSSVVAAAARQANLQSLVAVTGRSPSVSTWQLELAKRVADQLGIDHQIIETDETELSEYARNDGKRCFYCKQTLYGTLAAIAKAKADTAVICSGTNADDLGDYRPGIEAGREADIRTPLADLSLTKSNVRAVARHFRLSNAEIPASPCLASRIAYGVPVTADRLRRVEQAETWLRERDFSDYRVRVHEGELARVEVPLKEVGRLTDSPLAEQLSQMLQSIGFEHSIVDPKGLRSGNLNDGLVNIRSD